MDETRPELHTPDPDRAAVVAAATRRAGVPGRPVFNRLQARAVRDRMAGVRPV